MPPRLIALRPLRHECHLCGTCCQGWRVHLVSHEEEAKIAAQAAELGVTDPMMPDTPRPDGKPNYKMLRSHEGRCVFLSDEKRCRIHERWGIEEKPLVCRQYPRRVTLTEDGLRIGIDPTCSSVDRSWIDGPEIQPLVGMRSDAMLDATLAASENALLGLVLQPDMTVARFVNIITGSPTLDDELPVAFVARVIAALRVANLPPMLEDPELGPEMRWRLAPVAELLKTLDPTQPPTWAGALTPMRDAFALELLRRHLFLRLGDQMLPPIAQTLLVVMGIMLCAWSDPIGDYFGTTLSCWMRIIRFRNAWASIMPETETARWLLSGDGVAPTASRTASGAADPGEAAPPAPEHT
ncbi:MAG: YkgJ family cysteine cluster protein [Deltaproteobacteria bacterium]|nr:YkgJ family cysteine cluster protein [Deltaproteobacteria bacterium]